MSGEAGLDVSMKIKELFKEKPLITVELDHELEKALATMNEHKISWVPVVDDRGEFTGSIDFIDVLYHTLSLLQIYALLDIWKYRETDLSCIRNFKIKVREVMETKKTVPHRSEASFDTISWDQSFGEVLNKFCETKKHRFLLEDPRSILAQSDIVHLIARTLSDSYGEADIEDYLEEQPKLVIMSGSQSTLEAIIMIAKEKVSCIGIVDEFGVLIRNFSASDIKSFHIADFSSLLLPIKDFLDIFCTKPLIKIYASATFSKSMHCLVDNKVHRIWRVDLEGKPVGVITLTDFLIAFSKLIKK
jgi:CBS domain-containing protein